MTDYPSVDRISDLQKLVANFAQVERAVNLADSGRPENDVDHSFGLALSCWYLQLHVAPSLDVSKILRYALSHDIVEVHAGDTYVFDKAGVATKETRERDALTTLKNEWEDFSELTDFAEGYMTKRDEEAKFVYAVDKMLPLIMIELGDAKATWKKKSITLQMEIDNKKTILRSEQVAPYYTLIIEWLDARNNIPKN
jgi:putative hydrolase of HD superfamily